MGTDRDSTATEADLARENRARRILDKIRDYRWTIDFDGNLGVLAMFEGRTEPITEEHRAMALDFLPEIRAIRWPAPAAKRPESPTEPSSPTVAPKVPDRVKREISAMISALAEQPKERNTADVALLAAALVKALGPHKNEAKTKGCYFKVVDRCALGRIRDAFELACSPTAETRGAIFTSCFFSKKESRERSPART